MSCELWSREYAETCMSNAEAFLHFIIVDKIYEKKQLDYFVVREQPEVWKVVRKLTK